MPAPIPTDPSTVPPDRDPRELARSLLKISGPIPEVVSVDPASYTEGRRDTFSLIDAQEVRYRSEATLRLISPHAYWYVEDGRGVSRKELEAAAVAFEGHIYPVVTAAFGSEWIPGVDDDPHITILHADLGGGVGGYFSAVDEYSTVVHADSNQREMVYLSDSLSVGSPRYLSTLAHELQHLVHWNNDRGEEGWVTEGLSEVATSVAGYRFTRQDVFLRSPAISLINWPEQLSVHYGAAFLFFDYLASHYGTRDDLKVLVAEPGDDIQGINSYLSALGFQATFRDVFKDWVVANFLDEPGGGRYSYPELNVRATATGRMDEFGERRSSIPQYSAEYWGMDITRGDALIGFQGQAESMLLPTSLDGGSCWWGNRGDSISSTLTRNLDLSGVAGATLRYRVWFDLEEDWDYGYVQVSTDGGSTWDILQGPGTSSENPVGNNFGHGYTGTSDGWLQEEVDLSGYAGRRVLLRFHYVTDQALNGIGLCFRDISVPEVDFFDRGPGSRGWQSEGFVWTDNRVSQEYIVQVIEVGEETRVREIPLDGSNRGELVVGGLGELDRVVVVVAALSPKTLQDAGYTLSLRSAP